MGFLQACEVGRRGNEVELSLDRHESVVWGVVTVLSHGMHLAYLENKTYRRAIVMMIRGFSLMGSVSNSYVSTLGCSHTTSGG